MDGSAQTDTRGRLKLVTVPCSTSSAAVNQRVPQLAVHSKAVLQILQPPARRCGASSGDRLHPDVCSFVSEELSHN